MKVLVLGGGGMLGHALYRVLAVHEATEVLGTVRSLPAGASLPQSETARIEAGVAIEDDARLRAAIGSFRPAAIVNCIGAGMKADAAAAARLNAELPHRLAALATEAGARLVHIGSDGVFSGRCGGYTEADAPDSTDFYGRSKLSGEVADAHCLTLRTSIIGPELGAGKGLLTWFLAQQGTVKGFRRAIFSGFPTVELARIIADHVLPRPELHGVLHVGSAPISKFDLLKLIAQCYGKQIRILPDDAVVIDRSLDSTRFRALTGYSPPDWGALIARMHDFG